MSIIRKWIRKIHDYIITMSFIIMGLTIVLSLITAICRLILPIITAYSLDAREVVVVLFTLTMIMLFIFPLVTTLFWSSEKLISLNYKKTVLTILIYSCLLMCSCTLSQYMRVITSYYLLISLVPFCCLLKNLDEVSLKEYMLRLLQSAIFIFAPLVAISCIGIIYYFVFLENILKTTSVTELLKHVNGILRYGTVYPHYGIAIFFKSSNLWDWIFFGSGACGEIAEISQTILTRRGLKAFIAGFPAEDHVFTVVNMSGTWLVIDPGCYNEVLTLRERVIYRIIREEFNISYIIIYLNEEDFLEMTQEYVPCDTVIIKVTRYGIPVANVSITLVHKFQNYDHSIPGLGRCFRTNNEGIVVIHLGVPIYKRLECNTYEPYFWVCVNGKRTSYKVTSTGSYKTHYLHIELTEIDEH